MATFVWASSRIALGPLTWCTHSAQTKIKEKEGDAKIEDFGDAFKEVEDEFSAIC